MTSHCFQPLKFCHSFFGCCHCVLVILLAYVVPQADLIVAKATISFSEDTDDLFYGMTLFLSDKKIISLEMGQFIGSQTGAAPFGTALSRHH